MKHWALLLALAIAASVGCEAAGATPATPTPAPPKDPVAAATFMAELDNWPTPTAEQRNAHTLRMACLAGEWLEGRVIFSDAEAMELYGAQRFDEMLAGNAVAPARLAGPFDAIVLSMVDLAAKPSTASRLRTVDAITTYANACWAAHGALTEVTMRRQPSRRTP